MDRCGYPVDERLRAAASFFSLYGIAKIGAVYPERTNVYDKNTKTVKNELTFFSQKRIMSAFKKMNDARFQTHLTRYSLLSYISEGFIQEYAKVSKKKIS